MATNMPWKQPNTMVNASASSFLKQKKIPLFNTFTVHCLAPLYQFVHWRVSKIAVPCAGKMCRGFCCCHSLCFTPAKGRRKLCSFVASLLYKGVPNEGPDCHGLRNK